MNESDAKMFAAIKLIEQLFKDGRISKKIFEDILNEYRSRVDVSKFLE